MMVGCDNQNRAPRTVASTDHVRYAERYPARVERVSGDIEKGKSLVGGQSTELSSFPAQLQEPTDYDVVIEVVEAAEASGRSEAFVERAREHEVVARIMEENDREILRRVAGAVQYTAQQRSCSSDMGGAAVGAMKSSFAKRMTERLAKSNRAHEIIERNQGELGRGNIEKLKQQSDQIANLSYVAHVQLPTRRLELQRLLDERSAIDRTVARQIAEHEERQQRDASPKAQKASDERLGDLQALEKRLAESERYDAKQLAQLDREIKAAQDDLGDAIDKLVDDLRAKSSSNRTDGDAESAAP